MSAPNPAASAKKLYCLAVLVPPYAVYKIDTEAKSSGLKAGKDADEDDAVAMNMLLTLLGIVPGIAHALIHVRSHIRLRRRTAAPQDSCPPAAQHVRSSTSSSQALLAPSPGSPNTASQGQTGSQPMSQVRGGQTALGTGTPTATATEASPAAPAAQAAPAAPPSNSEGATAAPRRIAYVRVPSVMYCPVLNKEGGTAFGYEDRRVATMV